jgi:hypothetical protein
LSVDLPHLHGILKDKTRARVLELLEQREQLSYVELQTLLGIAHTGKLNYHLKILGDLISKDEQSGLYSLSEKGRVAVALLGKFQTMAESNGAVALKMKLKLALGLGVAGSMAALSLFFILIGIPGSSGTITLACSSSNSCSSSSQYATTFTPTLYALVPLLLATVSGFGFYKRKMNLVWLATVALFIFSIISLLSIGILYIPFAIALVALTFINRRNPHTDPPDSLSQGRGEVVLR